MIILSYQDNDTHQKALNWHYSHKLITNEIKVLYSIDFFYSSDILYDNIINFFTTSNDLITLLKHEKNNLNLFSVSYEESTFSFSKININIDLNDLNTIVLLSENIHSCVYYVSFNNNRFGDIYISSDHNTEWSLSINNVIFSQHNYKFAVDFHKVYYNN